MGVDLVSARGTACDMAQRAVSVANPSLAPVARTMPHWVYKSPTPQPPSSLIILTYRSLSASTTIAQTGHISPPNRQSAAKSCRGPSMINHAYPAFRPLSFARDKHPAPFMCKYNLLRTHRAEMSGDTPTNLRKPSCLHEPYSNLWPSFFTALACISHNGLIVT